MNLAKMNAKKLINSIKKLDEHGVLHGGDYKQIQSSLDDFEKYTEDYWADTDPNCHDCSEFYEAEELNVALDEWQDNVSFIHLCTNVRGL